MLPNSDLWFNMEAIPKSDIKSVIKSDISFDISIKPTTWIGHICMCIMQGQLQRSTSLYKLTNSNFVHFYDVEHIVWDLATFTYLTWITYISTFLLYYIKQEIAHWEGFSVKDWQKFIQVSWKNSTEGCTEMMVISKEMAFSNFSCRILNPDYFV